MPCLSLELTQPNPNGFWNPTQQPTTPLEAWRPRYILRSSKWRVRSSVWKLDASLPWLQNLSKKPLLQPCCPAMKGWKRRLERQNSFRILCPFEPLLGHNAHYVLGVTFQRLIYGWPRGDGQHPIYGQPWPGWLVAFGQSSTARVCLLCTPVHHQDTFCDRQSYFIVLSNFCF